MRRWTGDVHLEAIALKIARLPGAGKFCTMDVMDVRPKAPTVPSLVADVTRMLPVSKDVKTGVTISAAIAEGVAKAMGWSLSLGPAGWAIAAAAALASIFGGVFGRKAPPRAWCVTHATVWPEATPQGVQLRHTFTDDKVKLVKGEVLEDMKRAAASAVQEANRLLGETTLPEAAGWIVQRMVPIVHHRIGAEEKKGSEFEKEMQRRFKHFVDELSAMVEDTVDLQACWYFEDTRQTVERRMPWWARVPLRWQRVEDLQENFGYYGPLEVREAFRRWLRYREIPQVAAVLPCTVQGRRCKLWLQYTVDPTEKQKAGALEAKRAVVYPYRGGQLLVQVSSLVCGEQQITRPVEVRLP